MKIPGGLERAFLSRRISEAAETYACADAALGEPRDRPEASQRQRLYRYRKEDRFWSEVNWLGDKAWNAEVEITEAAVSEWVARVPGLFWEPRARALRELMPSMTELIDKRWRTFPPLGKSSKVVGGIGTMRLAPATDGYRLGTLTLGLNASAGVPALISPEVWDGLGSMRGLSSEGKLAGDA